MQKVDLESMSIDDLAQLCDLASEKLAEKIAARQKELSVEMEKLTVLSKKAKVAAPKKDMKDIRDALKPQEAPKPQDAGKPAIKAA